MSRRIALSGSHGFIGSHLFDYLIQQGDKVTRIVREGSETEADKPYALWDTEKEQMDHHALKEHETVIHLAGANISKRWTPKHKRDLYFSRVNSTELLSEVLAGLRFPPKLFICASAVGYYGTHDSDESLTEDSEAGDDFLASICKQWENATKPLEAVGCRVVNLRIGPVLGPGGGALAKMLPPFKLGLGGRLGSGTQMFSWVALDEIPGIIEHIFSTPELSGPVNVVSPNPVSNFQLTKALGAVINRPTVFPVPSFGIKLLFGEMGETILLKGSKVLPARLLETGYQFRYADIGPALRACF